MSKEPNPDDFKSPIQWEDDPQREKGLWDRLFGLFTGWRNTEKKILSPAHEDRPAAPANGAAAGPLADEPLERAIARAAAELAERRDAPLTVMQASGMPENAPGQAYVYERAEELRADQTLSSATRHLARLIAAEQHWALRQYLETVTASGAQLPEEARGLLKLYGQQRFVETSEALYDGVLDARRELFGLQCARETYVRAIVEGGAVDARTTLALLERDGRYDHVAFLARTPAFEKDRKAAAYMRGFHRIEAARHVIEQREDDYQRGHDPFIARFLERQEALAAAPINPAAPRAARRPVASRAGKRATATIGL